MSQATTSPAAAVAADAVRVVLFGMPDAGKSSLLGALAQAAQMQEHVLNGRLIDRSQGLIELQRRLYEERPRETLEEVAPYPVRFEPFPPRDSTTAPPPIDAVLFDCDGRVANDIIGRKDELNGAKSEGALAHTLMEADTLVLVVDASAEPAVLKRDFSQFAAFLRLLEQSRGRRAEVGGLPVYLVLTKCDLLAHPNDTAVSWIDRIEERKRQVDRGFKEFLAKQAERESMPFGKIELHLWATAVKRPALADSPARPKEPYGVAELFRQCLDAAGTHRDQRQRAQTRLKWTVGLVGALVVAMLGLAGFLFLSQPNPETARLAGEVNALKSQTDPKAEKRLRGALQERVKKLDDVKANRAFTSLPQDLQDFVVVNLDELKAYQDFDARVKRTGVDVKSLHLDTPPEKLKALFGEVPALGAEELQRVKEELEGVQPPVAYRTSWAETDAMKDLRGWLKEVTAVEAAARKTRTDYERLLEDAKRAQALWAKDQYKDAVKLAREVVQRGKALPSPKSEAPLEGDVTYAQVFRVMPVAQAYDAWEKSEAKKKVERLVEG